TALQSCVRTTRRQAVKGRGVLKDAAIVFSALLQLREQRGEVDRKRRDGWVGLPIDRGVVDRGLGVSRQIPLDLPGGGIYDPVLAPMREIHRALLAAVVPAGRSGQDFDRQGRAPQLLP